jgi:hypothetical protein
VGVLDSPAIAPISAAALVALAVLLIFRGQLIPRRTHENVIAAKDEQIRIWKERGDEYKTAWQHEVEARSTRDAQLGELVEYARFADQMLRALREVGQQ